MADGWETEQELIFLKHLGTYREGHERTPMRLQLLANDIQTARARVDWGNVNGKQVIAFAEAQYAEEYLRSG